MTREPRALRSARVSCSRKYWQATRQLPAVEVGIGNHQLLEIQTTEPFEMIALSLLHAKISLDALQNTRFLSAQGKDFSKSIKIIVRGLCGACLRVEVQCACKTHRICQPRLNEFGGILLPADGSSWKWFHADFGSTWICTCPIGVLPSGLISRYGGMFLRSDIQFEYLNFVPWMSHGAPFELRGR